MKDRNSGPMLAAAIKDLRALKYPFLTSIKLDGIRAWTTPDGPLTRANKPIPNRYVRAKLAELPYYLDGELCVLDSNGGVNFRDTASAIMSHDGEPQFSYMVFDHWQFPHISFTERLFKLRETQLPEWCVILNQKLLATPEEVEDMFFDARKLDHEGLILRSPHAPYKFGRSTLREQGMLKMKPWEDDEAQIIGTTEEMFNANEATVSETGRTARSSHQENKIPKGTLGTLVVRNSKWPQAFEIGTGFTAAERRDLWALKAALPGRIAKFKYINAGNYDVPRHAVFLGFRSREDM